MKTLLFSIVFLMLFSSLVRTNQKNRMIYSDFKQGIVTFKNGTTATAPLNYDTYEEEMVFNNKGKTMAVASPETILKIEIEGKTFECLEGDVFLEKLDTAGIVVFRRNRNQLMSKGKGVPFGGVSNNSAVATVKRLPHGAEGQAKNLEIDEDFELIPDHLFYIKLGSRFKLLSSPKQVSKVYGFDKKALEKYINAQKLDLQKFADVIQVIKYTKSNNLQ